MRQWMSRKVNYTMTLGLLVVFAVANVFIISAFWGEPVNVSNNQTVSDRPSIAVDASGKIHLVWADGSLNYPLNTEILYRSSSDGGVTWGNTTPMNLSNSPERSLLPKIAVADNDQRIIAWADGTNTAVRLWNGNAWTPTTMLSNSDTPTRQISVAINSDGIALVVWTEGFGSLAGYDADTIPDERGFYRRWNGTAWEPAQSVAARLVTLRNDLAYLATERGTLLRSTDAGQSWSEPINLPFDYYVPADMQLDSTGKLHLAWFDERMVLAGSYDGLAFSTPSVVDNWSHPALETYNDSIRAQIGAVTALALAVNSFDQIGLVWAAPDLTSVTTNYRPNGVNNLGSEAVYYIVSSQSLDGHTWTNPSMQNEPGGFPAIAAAAEGSDFYGTWRSPGNTPDVFVALNRRPDPIYQETFSSFGRLFAKGIEVKDSTASLNSANPLDWPLFGASQQGYGSILRGQTGVDEITMLSTCLTTFNTLTGQARNPGSTLCLPIVNDSSSANSQRMRFVDGLIHDSIVYVLASSYEYDSITFEWITKPHLLLMDLATGTVSNRGQPASLPNSLDFGSGTLLAVSPDGSMLYAVINSMLYRYNISSSVWTDLNQPASTVTVAPDGTVYIGHEQRLLSSTNSGTSFTQRSSDFSTGLLHADRNGCVIGVENGRPINGFRPATSTVVSSTDTILQIWSPRNALGEASDGTVYLINNLSYSGSNDQLLRYNCATNSLIEQASLPLLRPAFSDDNVAGLVIASDGRIWMSPRELVPVMEQNPIFDGLVAYPLTPLVGEIVSPPIFSESGQVIWGTLTYSATVPAGASFGVDVLDMQGAVLRENVASGTSLEDLPAVPLRLRARMQAPNAVATPVLRSWQLTWQPIERRVARLSATEPLVLPVRDGTLILNFPAGVVKAETTVTYTEQLTPTVDLGDLRFAGRSFNIVVTGTNGNPVTSFEEAFTLTLKYNEAELELAGINEEDLDLVFWNGSGWVSTSPTIDKENNQVIATLDHLTEFALVAPDTALEEPSPVYLPFVRR